MRRVPRSALERAGRKPTRTESFCERGTVVPMAILVMFSNYFHDLATAIFAVSAVTAYLLPKPTS